MKTKLLQDKNPRIWAVIFDKGDEVASGLLDAARQHGMDSSSFTAIGALSEVRLGYFDRESRDYKETPVHEQVEVLSLAGNIALHNGEPKVHAHIVVGCRDGTALGGHLMEGRVWPTLEAVITESPGTLKRVFDEESQLPLIDLEAR